MSVEKISAQSNHGGSVSGKEKLYDDEEGSESEDDE